jgi:hypothetical protein
VLSIEENSIRLVNILASDGHSLEANYKCVLVSDIALIRHIATCDSCHLGFAKELNYLDTVFKIRAQNSHTYNFDNNSFNHVEVTIHVTKSSIDQQGYLVGYSTAFWYDNPPIFFANTSTSPTVMNIPPGEYMFHIMKNNKDIGSMKKTIGDQNATGKQKIELQID